MRRANRIYSGPCGRSLPLAVLHASVFFVEGGGPGIGGDGGSMTKQNISTSETADNSATAGGDNYGGGKGNVVNSNEVAIAGLETVEKIATAGIGTLFGARSLDTKLAETFAETNATQSNNALAAISKLAETKITDGANLNTKTTMAALAIGGVILVFSMLRRK